MTLQAAAPTVLRTDPAELEDLAARAAHHRLAPGGHQVNNKVEPSGHQRRRMLRRVDKRRG